MCRYAHGLFEFDGIFIVFDTRVRLRKYVYLCPIITKFLATWGTIFRC